MADQQPIDNDLLGKFLADKTDPTESAWVRQWLAGRRDGSLEPGYADFTQFKRIRKAASRPARFVSPRKFRSGALTDADHRTLKKQAPVSGTTSGFEPIINPLANASDPQPPGWYPLVYRIVAVLGLVTTFGGLLYQLLDMSQDHVARQAITLVTNGQPIRKTLPDRTRVVVGPHSILICPTAFANYRRDVTLTGEAFFDITSDPTRPFRVLAGPVVVQGLRASFSVRAYEAQVSVAVRAGKVRVASGREVVWLTKNQRATVETKPHTTGRTLLVLPINL